MTCSSNTVSAAVSTNADPSSGTQSIVQVNFPDIAQTLELIFSPESMSRCGVVIEEAQDIGIWVRDHQVILLNGSYLLPHKVDQDGYERVNQLAKIMFPTHKTKINFGQGAGEPSRRTSPRVFYNSICHGATCIEGGNIQFCTINNEKGAIVGFASVLLSMLTMERQGNLSGATQKSAQENPAEFSIRLADHWEIVLGKMADELGIFRKNLLIVEHDQLHIDLELLVGPGNLIFLHDPSFAIQSASALQDQLLLQKDHPGLPALEKELKFQRDYFESGIFARK